MKHPDNRKRRSALGTLAVALGVAVLAAACTTTSSEGSEEVSEALGALNSAVDQLNTQAAQLHDASHALNGRLDELEVSLVLDTSRVGAGRAQFLPPPPDGMVTVQFLAEALNAAVPGQFNFFLAPEGAPVFETLSLPEGEVVETGPPLENGIAFVEPGVLYDLQVVYQNPTSETVRFLVPGGTLDPQGALPFVRNRCWCAAVPFEAPPNGTFSRVIQVGVGPDTPPGARAVMIWPVASLHEEGS